METQFEPEVTTVVEEKKPRIQPRAGLTRKQWSTGVKGIHILLCGPCWSRFRDTPEKMEANESGQTISIQCCRACLNHNHSARFDSS